jgi:hypothetical protein
MKYIKTIDLRKKIIPLSNRKISLIDMFALTFDLSEIDNQTLEVDLDSDFDTLSIPELRYILYYEQRRWNHFGRNYDTVTEKKIRQIIQKIEDIVPD